MFNLFKSKIKKSWGLHITDRHLRSIEISGDYKNWKIKRISKVDLPLGIIENGLIKDQQALKNYVKQLVDKALPTPLKSPFVIVNLADEHTFSKTIQLPLLTQEEISEAIQWEAESNIPLPIDKIYLSWKSLPKNTGDKKESVLFAATPKNIINNLIETFKAVKLIPIIIESESTALMRSLTQTQSFPSPETPIMVLNLREHYTQIIIFCSRVVIFSTTSEHASQEFDAVIESTFKIKNEDSEKFRQKIGWDANEELGKKLIETTRNPFLNLKKEISSAISFFNNESGRNIEEILLTGEKRNKWKKFDNYMEKELGIPVKWQGEWNPNVWPANCSYITPEKEEYNVGIGLALRKLEETVS